MLIDQSTNKLKPTDQQQPRFLCLAAGGYSIGIADKFKQYVTKNQTSILALIYWPGTRRCSYYTGGDGFPKLAVVCVRAFLWANMDIAEEGPTRITVMKLDHHGSSKEFLESLGPKPPETEEQDIAGASTLESESKLSDEFKDYNMITFAEPKHIIVTPGPTHGHPSKLRFSRFL